MTRSAPIEGRVISTENLMRRRLGGMIATGVFYAISLTAGASSQQPQPPGTPIPLKDIAVSELRLVDLRGSAVALAKFKRPVVLNVWATFCVPCRKQIPLLNELAAKHQEIAVIGVSLGEPVDDVATAARELAISYQLVSGSYGQLSRLLQREVGIPMTLFIRADGSVADLLPKLELSSDEWERRLAPLLSGK